MRSSLGRWQSKRESRGGPAAPQVALNETALAHAPVVIRKLATLVPPTKLTNIDDEEQCEYGHR